ncbi:MAG: hypothetical protein J5732_09115 [Bacteroidaceae bacterium]|nr:hypothetical protein [Bacteroidaceae bacterium]
MIKCSSVLILMTTAITTLLESSCGGHIINSIDDSHYTSDGHLLDSIGEVFKSVEPTSIDFYVEVSGSMNGFFRANRATAFKTDVWAIVSNFGSPGVSVLSNSGTQATKYTGDQFRNKMNSGGFVSTAETQVPAMLESILSKLDYENGAVAVLISDMKYSPVGNKALPVLLQQYATDIRNIVGKYPGSAFSLVGAYSEYLDVKGNVACERSPYYYLVVGKDVCVAKIRNCITIILSDRGNYLDNIEIGFDYKRPAYGFGVPDNVIQLDDEPTFYNYDVSYSDTCKVVLNLDLSDFRWLITSDEDVLRDNFKVKAVYGSEIEVGKIDININNHNEKKLERLAVVSVELKLWNMPMDADVIEWTLAHPEYSVTDTFMQIQNAAAESDLTGSFSLANFIQGVFQAVQNHWNQEPNRILISKSN